MRIAALQSDIAWEDPPANFARLDNWIATAAAGGARLLALPEMFACGFSMNTSAIAEPPEGPTYRFMAAQATEHGLWIAGSFPELEPGHDKPSNTLLVVGPEGQDHRYRKIHPFSFAGEDRHFRAGDRFVQVEIEGLRITLFVCYDLRFADEFWVTAEATDAYLVVANWPQPRRHHWITLLQARAIENQAYVIGVNRVGEDQNLSYTGDSHIVDPMGQVLASASGQETLLFADVDPKVVAETRRKLPFFPDRRP